MVLSPAKLRLAVFGPSPPDLNPYSGLVIHRHLWSPALVPLRTSVTIKMLGVTFDTAGSQRTQKGAMKHRLARACATMFAQRQLDCAVIAASVSSLTPASARPH